MIITLPDDNSALEDYQIFSDVDLIVTDLDGTLIAGPGPIVDQIKKDIDYLRRKRKVQITIATGRTYFGAKPLMKEIDIAKGMPVALYNGGVVIEYGTNQILHQNQISQEIVVDLAGIIDLSKVTMLVYTLDLPIIHVEGDEAIEETIYGLGMRSKQKDSNGMDIQWLDNIYEIKYPIVAILLESRQLSYEERDLVLSYLGQSGQASFTDSGNGYIEIKGPGLDKGSIFRILKNQKKYKVNKILAIGDNDNDTELFQYADISIAVANCSPIAMEAASYICRNKSADGFLDMLKVLKYSKKYCAKER